MKRLSIILGVIVVIAFAIEAVPEEVTIEEAPLTWKQASLGDGEALYVELCAVCHGLAGKGDGPAVPALAAPPPDLTTLTAENDGVFPAERVQASIAGNERVTAHGTVEMPIWGAAFRDVRPDHKMARRESFARMRVYNLTTFVESLQGK